MSTEVRVLPLDWPPLRDALRLAVVYGSVQVQAFARGDVDGDTLVIDVNGEDHFCDLCGQLYAEPLVTLEIPFGVQENDRRRVVVVVLGICEGCRAELASRSQVVEVPDDRTA